MTQARVLLIDDDADFAESLRELIGREGFECVAANSLREARNWLNESEFDVLLVDLELPDGNGLELLHERGSTRGDFVVITGYASVDTAVEALREGATDYLTKPFDRARLRAVLGAISRNRVLRAEVRELRQELLQAGRFGPMVGRSEAMQQIYRLIERVAPESVAVLISGESGTGKELAAETIHQLSPRRGKPFVALNCGAVSPQLVESELFGHEKGSFTGAARQHVGYFERADGGTLLLDEITEMPLELQVKLLRVLETDQVVRVGGTRVIDVDVRVIAATNQDAEEAVRKGRLREDLFYRLNVFPLSMPPLRDRKGDLGLLAEYFLAEFNRDADLEKRWTAAALKRLGTYRWPGNVREFQNVAHRAFLMADEDIDVDCLPVLSSDADDRGLESESDTQLRVRVGTDLATIERRMILATLNHFEGDKRKAARTLGISLKTLYNRLNVYEAMGESPPPGVS